MFGRLPLIRSISRKLRTEFDSGGYWNSRYKSGRNSGAGSYGRLAEYKAETINALVKEFDVTSVLEIGSGDGHQASLFDFENYTGLDVAFQVVAAARERFKDRETWSFETIEDASLAPRSFDMTMSLDVIYHLVEDDIFDRYMTDLFTAADRLVLVYASDHDAAALASHVRHRRYSDWVAKNAPDFEAVRTLEQPYPKTAVSLNKDTSFAFFRLFQRQGF